MTPNDLAAEVAREAKWSLNHQTETRQAVLTLHRVDLFFAFLFGGILGAWLS